MLAIRLPEEIEARLDQLAKRTGRSKTFYAREAILEHLDNLEELYLAEQVMQRIQRGEEKTSALDAMKPITDKPMTVRLPAEVAIQLDKLIQATGRNKNAITVAALRDYVGGESWQIQDTEEGLAEADRGEFASADDVNAFFAKYGG